MSPVEFHQLCRTLGVQTVIVTLGQRGCLVSEPTRHTLIAAHSGLSVVDTTGAGDAFVGGFAAALAQLGGDVLAAARRGNATAALSVTKFGTAPSMPTQAEIEKFLATRALGETPI
jgi:ribokinase